MYSKGDTETYTYHPIMNTKSSHKKDSEDYEDYDYFPSYRARSHTVSEPYQVQRQYYFRTKARIAASKISRQETFIDNEPQDLKPGSHRSRTSSFSSYFLPSSRPKSKPKMETSEQFWNRYRRQPRIHSFGSVMRQILFPVPRINF